MNRITRNMIVTLDYKATDTEGNLLDEGTEPLEYLHGGYEGIFLPIEVALNGKAVGDSVSVKLQPADAFGEYEPELVDVVSLDELPQPLSVGMQIEGNPEDGGDDERFFLTVTDIAEGKAVLDGNHPLAGVSMLFDCTVSGIRPATATEIAAAQGAGAGSPCMD